MFRCHLCGDASKPGESPLLYIIEEREKRYPHRFNANYRRIDGQRKYTDDPGGKGWEIVREVLTHPSMSGNHSEKDMKLNLFLIGVGLYALAVLAFGVYCVIQDIRSGRNTGGREGREP